jgi:hypothetical protein
MKTVRHIELHGIHQNEITLSVMPSRSKMHVNLCIGRPARAVASPNLREQAANFDTLMYGKLEASLFSKLSLLAPNVVADQVVQIREN